MDYIFLYMDPSIPVMLFTIVCGISAVIFYSIKLAFSRLKHRILGGKVDVNKDKIPFVIYAESKTYFHIFDSICRELDLFGKNILYITQSPDDPMLNNKYTNLSVEVIDNENKLFAKLNILKANILLTTTPGLNVFQWKKTKYIDYYVFIMHAANEILTYKMFGIDYYDALLLSGEYQIKDVRDLENVRNLPKKELKIVGVPYLDEMQKRKKECNKKEEKKKDIINVLLAPAWGDIGILAKYGDKFIDRLISSGYNVIIRPHPQSLISEKNLIDKLENKYKNCERVSWSFERDNFDTLNNADIMVSDYSGVIFDYTLVFDKPILYTNPKLDYDKFDASWLNRPIWTESALPKLGLELTEDRLLNIKETIDYVLKEDKFVYGRKEVKSETWQEEGKGAINVKDFLIGKYNDLIANYESMDKNAKK